MIDVTVVAIGDIGVQGSMIHIGDEAMFEALLDQLRARGFSDFVGISSHPEDTAARYGIGSVARIGFDAPNRDDRMRRVLGTATGQAGLLDPDDPAHAVIRAVRQSTGVAIAGGGNISSLWPTHIYERATLGALATVFGRPLVISGQTIGPQLSPADAALVHTLLASARSVSLREPDSLALCRRLGVPEELLSATADDASFLVDAAATGNYCLVSIASHVAGHDRAAVSVGLAGLLDEVVARTGLEVVFLAHFASLDPATSAGDSVMHDLVIAAMTAPARVVATTDSVAAATLARGAALVVSSRYHPVVFAVAAGVPAIGIPVDDYTSTKLSGALGNFGQHALLPAEGLADAPRVVAGVWESREETRTRGLELAAERHRAAAEHWDAVADALR